MNKKRYWLFLTVVVIGFVLANSNYQFQIERIDAGTWETVERVEGGTSYEMADTSWTTRYDKQGITTNNEDGAFTYVARVGERNVWNGSDYVPYIWNAAERIVTYASHEIEFYDWYTVIKNESHTLVDDCRWQVYYWSETGGGKWGFLDLYSHDWLSAITNNDNMTFGQSYTDGSSTMNVTYTFRNCDMVKIAIGFQPSFAGTFRFVWQITGLLNDPVLLKAISNRTEGLAFDNLNIMWKDVEETTLINATYDWQPSQKKVDVNFGPIVLDADEDYLLDPSVSPHVSADSDDDSWYTTGTEHKTDRTNNYYSNDGGNDRWGQIRIQLNIPQYAAVSSATVYFYDALASNPVEEFTCYRIDEWNVGSLEGDSSPPAVTATDHAHWTLTAALDWEDVSITTMVNNYVNNANYASGYYLGLRVFDLDSTSDFVSFVDIQSASGNEAYISVTYTNPPRNYANPSILTLDDTDTLYSRYRRYEVTTYHRDADGYADINYVQFYVYNEVHSTLYFYGKMIQSSHVFSEEGTTEQKNNWQLTGSTYSEHDTYKLDITWKFYIEWECPDVVDLDVRCYVQDSSLLSDNDYYDYLWDSSNNRDCDIETDLEYDTTPTITSDDAGTVDRGDLDETFHITGDVSYEGSSLTPPSGDVDVWVACTVGGYGTNVGPWEDDTLGATGLFDVTCYADDEVGLETYTIKVVKEGDGYSGTDLITGADPTDDYIADQIVIQTTVVDDARVSVNANAEIRVTAKLAYEVGGVVWLGSGDIMTLDNTAMNWDAVNSWFDLPRSQASVGIWKYYVNSSSETGHGVTGLDLNSQDVDVIWDRVQVQSYSVSDSRDDINDNVNIDALLWYDYDNTLVIDGTATINGYSAAHQGSGVWRITRTSATVTSVTYNTVAASGNTHGITAVDQNGQSIDVIWDRVEIYSIIPYDEHHGAGTGTSIQYYFRYDYLSQAGVIGTFTTDTTGDTLIYQAANRWDATVNEPLGIYIFDGFTTCSESQYGLTAWIFTGSAGTIDFDTVRALDIEVSDDRCNYGTDQWVRVRFDYESAGYGYVTSWSTTPTITGPNGVITLSISDGSGWWRGSTGTYSSVAKFTYNTNTLNDFIDVDAILSRSKGTFTEYTIWDRILINTVGAVDTRLDYGTSTIIYATAYLEYTGDGTHWLTNGDTLYINDGNNDFLMSWDAGDSRFEYSATKSSVNKWTWTVSTSNANEASFTITSLNQNGKDVDVIWDRILIITTAATSSYIDKDTGATTVNVTARLEYTTGGEHWLGSGDTLYMDDTQMTWDSDHFYVVIGPYGTFGSWACYVNSTGADEATYSITVINLNGQSDTVATDQIKVISYSPSDAHDNIDDYIWVTVTLQYESDSSQMTDGTVVINGYSYSHIGSGQWRHNRTQSTVTGITFDTVVTAGNTRGITVVNQNGQSQLVIWDELQVTGLHANNTEPALDEYVLLNVSMIHKYDSAAVSAGSFTLEGLSLSWNGVTSMWEVEDVRSVPSYITYNDVIGTASLYGISALDMNGWTVSVNWTAGNTHINITLTISFGWTVINYNITIYYSGVYHPTGDPWSGTCQINSTASTFYPEYSTTGSRLFVPTSVTDPIYGITDFYAIQNVTCIWDDIECTSIAYTWEMYDLIQIQMLLDTGTFKWEINGTNIGSGHDIDVYVNSTLQVDETTDGSSQIPDKYIGPFDHSWYHGHFVGNGTVTAGARTFTATWWDEILEIPVSHTIHLASFDVDEYDDYIWFSWSTVWNNGTFTLWDNSTLITYIDGDPATYRLSKSMILGLHNLTILINCTDTGGHQSEQTKDFSASDYWLWVNYYYNIETDIDAGVCFIRNELGFENMVEFCFYKNESLFQRAPSGETVYLKMTLHYYISGDESYTPIRATYYAVRSTTDGGFCNWAFDSDFAHFSLCMPATALPTYYPRFKLYWAADNSTWTYMNMFSAVNPYNWQITAVHEDYGVLITVDYDNPITLGLVTPTYPEEFEAHLDDPYQTDWDRYIFYWYIIITDWGDGSGATHYFYVEADSEIFLPYEPLGALSIGLILRQSIHQSFIADPDAGYVDELDSELPAPIKITNDFALVQDTGLTYSGQINIAADITIIEDDITVGTANITEAGSFSIWWSRAVGTGNITAILMFENFDYSPSVMKNITVIYEKVSSAAASYDWAYIYTYNQGGDYIDWENFIFYINGTEQPTNFFYNNTAHVYNITLTDIFGDTIYSANHTFARAYRLELAIHSFQLVSQLFEPIWIRLTSSGGGYKEVWLYREVPYEWWLYENVTYQWYWDIDQAGMGQPTGPHYYPTDGSWYEPTSAMMYLMTGWGISELFDAMPDSQGGGGGLTEADIANITQSVIDDISALLDPMQGGSVGLMIVGGFMFLGYLQYGVLRQTRKPKKQLTPEERIEQKRRKQEEKRLKSKKKSKSLRSRLRPKKMRNNQ